MTTEYLLWNMADIEDCFIEEAEPAWKPGLFRRRTLALLLAAVLALLLVSCGISAFSEEWIQEWFLRYKIEDYMLRMSQAEVRVLDATEEYALVFYSGMGPSLQLYRYETEAEQLTVTDYATGAYTVSGGISINHLETDGKHIYFGTVSNSHWNPAENVVNYFIPDRLRLTDGSGVSVEVTVSEGYLVIMDEAMMDFQLLDRKGMVCLDRETYLAQGYSVEEQNWSEGER